VRTECRKIPPRDDVGAIGPRTENKYFTEMCSGSESGSYLRLIDFVYHSTLRLRVIKKKKRTNSPRTRCLPAERERGREAERERERERERKLLLPAFTRESEQERERER